MTDRHIAYEQYLEDDENGDPIYRNVYCGDTDMRGNRAYCQACTNDLLDRYPQGWNDYPGDTCEHGVCVGGVGIDVMCHNCEQGLTFWHDNPEYALVVAIGEGAGHIAMGVDSWYTAREGDIKYGCEKVTEYLERIVRIIVGDDSIGWHVNNKPAFTFHTIEVSAGYWSDEAQEVT